MMTPAMVRLGVLLARPLLQPNQRAEVQSLAPGLDARAWQALVERWLTLRVGAWVHEHAQALGLRLPPPLLARLNEQWLVTVQRSVACDQLRQVLRPLLEGPSAPLLQLKGAVIEARAYPPGVLRPHGDLDVLVRPGAAWQTALRELGLRPLGPLRGHEQSWALPDAPVAVDVHLTLADPRRYPGLATAHERSALFDRAQVGRDGLLQLHELDQSAHVLVHLGPGLYGDWRHLADAAQWWRAVEPDPTALVARLATWRARSVARSAVLALAWFEPDPAWTTLQTALGGPGWRALAFARTAEAWLRVGRFPWPTWLEGLGVLAQLG